MVVKSLKYGVKVDFEELSLKFLDLYDLIYGFTDIKLGTIFSEFALFHLRVIQNVIDQEAQYFGTRILDFGGLNTFIIDCDQFIFEHFRWFIGIHFLYKMEQLGVGFILFDAKSTYWVYRVTHLVWHGGIDDS